MRLAILLIGLVFLNTLSVDAADLGRGEQILPLEDKTRIFQNNIVLLDVNGGFASVGSVSTLSQPNTSNVALSACANQLCRYQRKGITDGGQAFGQTIGVEPISVASAQVLGREPDHMVVMEPECRLKKGLL